MYEASKGDQTTFKEFSASKLRLRSGTLSLPRPLWEEPRLHIIAKYGVGNKDGIR